MTKKPHIVRSRYRIFNALFWDAFALFIEFIMLLIVVRSIAEIIDYGAMRTVRPFHWFGWVIVMTNILLWGYFLNVRLRYVVIDGERGCATYYSILRPWGKRFFFSDYTGVYLTDVQFYHSLSYAVHLVDGERIVRLMSCALYRNYDELRGAIPLPEVKKHIGFRRLVALALTGRTKVSKHWKNKLKI